MDHTFLCRSRRGRARRTGVARLGLMGFLLLPAPALAIDYSVTANYFGEYTDNALLERDGGKSDFAHRPGFAAMATHLGLQTQLDLEYSGYRRIYQNDSFDSDTILQGAARASWSPLVDRLTLFVADTRRESEIRTQQQAVPDNLQTTSDTTAGAVLRADLWSTHYGTIGYSYGETIADVTQTDSSRQNVQVAYVMPFSETNILQLVATGDDTDFDDPLASDYKALTGALAYDRQSATMALSLQLGYTDIERELGRGDSGGYTGSINVLRQLGGQSSLRAMYSRAYRDNSLAAWRQLQGVGGEVVVGDTDLNEVYLQETAALTLVTQIGVNRATIFAVGTTQDYDTDITRDTDRIGLTFALSRPIRPNVNGTADINYTRYEFSAENDEDQYRASVGVDWNASRRFTTGVSVQYYQRSTSGAILGDTDAWSFIVRMNYLLFGNGT